MNREFNRKIYSRMLQWKAESNGATALLIKGARRIGKSTIAEIFARKEYKSYIFIDFAIASEEIRELFNQLHDLDYFFLRLQSLCHVSLIARQSVIIFDEVQLFPPARQAIKHLVKDGRYDYIETGSLLSIRKNVKDILIPSEETRINMYPMDYEEFLWAVGRPQTIDLIRYAYENSKPVGEKINREMMRLFRLYMLIGGMPQAINTYLDTNDFAKVDAIKRNILEIYADDFRKIDSSGHLSKIFYALPAQLSRNTTRFKIGSVIKNATSARLNEPLMDLADSMVVNFAYRTNDPHVDFPLHADYNHFKMYLNDTGLFVTLAYMNRDYTENDIYTRLLSDKMGTDLGYVYENVIAQMLRTAGNELFYYTFQEESETGRVKQYEVDFVLARKNKILPIEVKSSSYKQHKSLDKFQDKFSSRIASSYVLYTKDIAKKANVTYLPVYMAGLL